MSFIEKSTLRECSKNVNEEKIVLKNYSLAFEFAIAFLVISGINSLT